MLNAEVNCDDGCCFFGEACGVGGLLGTSEAARMMERLRAIDFEMVWNGGLQAGPLWSAALVLIQCPTTRNNF
jgi:hypothetical protein